MVSIINTLVNTICHIIIDGQAQQKFYLISHIIMLLQTIACIADPTSILFLLVKWFDPSNYLDPSFSIVLCFAIIILFTFFIILKLIITQPDQMLVKPNTLKIYMGNILLHMQMLSKTFVLSPLIRSTIIQIQNPGTSATQILGIIAFTIYIAFLLPLSLYNTSNTFVLTPQLNKKLTYINIYLLLNIFRIPFAILSPTNQPLLIAISTIFFIIFLSMSIKQPIFAYSHQRFLKGMISAIAFTCLLRFCQAIQNTTQQPLLLQLVGMGSFICLIDWISQFRVKKILQSPHPTIHQVKILIFLISNIRQYFEKLQYFIIRHHRRCLNPECQCSMVISHISSKGKVEGQYDDKIWFKFLIDYIQQHYNLQQIQKLPQSEMLARIQKYQYIVIDLAQMYLFKLEHVNQAYYIVNNFRHLLETRDISFTSFRQKKKIINYYLQENISIKYHTEGIVNLNADNYMNFQIAYEKYRKILLRAAKGAHALWQQMGKRQPDNQKIQKLVKLLDVWQNKIRQMYKDIKMNFQKSDEIIEVITNDYFQKVLNISVKSPFHVIQIPKFQNIVIKNEDKVQKISQNMQAFSYNSETPMCFVGVDEQNFGKIVACNSHFNKIMTFQFGSLAKIDQFMLPQMRKSHEIKMRQFIKGDTFSLEHKNGFTLNLKGKIIYTKILVQIMPSIVDGLRYVFFLKKLMQRKKIVGIKNNQTMIYTSQNFDDSFDGKSRKGIINNTLKQQILSELRQNRQIKIQYEQRQIFLKLLYQFNDEQASWLFIQYYQQQDFLLETRYNLIGQKSNGFQTKKMQQTVASKNRKDSIISRNSGYQFDKTNMQKSDLNEKLAIQKQKKIDQTIKNTYSFIINKDKIKIMKKIIIFTILIIILLIAIFLATVFVKLNNQKTYLNTITYNKLFNTLIFSISNTIYNFKMANFYQYTANTTLAPAYLALASKYSNVSRAMDNFVINFDVNSITETWSTLYCSSNNTFALGNENNFLTVSDFIQNPLTNLINLNISSFNFAPNLNAQKTPLGGIQCFYYELILNSLYFIIPNFLKLKRQKIDKILLDNVSVSIIIILLFISIFIISIIYIIGKVLLNMRITRLKNQTYQIFDSLQKNLFIQKEIYCKEFIIKYTLVNTGPQQSEDYNIFSDQQRQIDLNITTISKNQKNIEQYTQRELEIEPHNHSTHSNKTSNFIRNASLKERSPQVVIKSNNTFQKSSLTCIIFKYTILIFPFILFAIIFGSLQLQQAKYLSKAIQIQSKIQNIYQNINLVTIYALQNGVEDGSYQKIFNPKVYISSLLSQIYDIQRSFVSSSYDFSYLPSLKNLLTKIAYSDLCNSSEVTYQSYFNKSCAMIGQNILRKGFYSSLISYIESLNTLLLNYPNTYNFTNSQRLQYLSNTFFTSNGELMNYLLTIINKLLITFSIDFIIMVTSSTGILIFANIGLVIFMLIIIFIFQSRFIQAIQNQLLQIKSLLVMISYQTIMNDQQLKQKFYNKVQDFKKLK